eukprot:TRINITY_DN8902_c0_g2_i1.p1 TRINITY_DN8902_c0_g2~~TRINITY_DN8902_c0_g2_i1.p1  ORF type:complete len:1210 (+),score=145.82 TRINITY_DN8902_c0_g2_i1:90-3719(+)
MVSLADKLVDYFYYVQQKMGILLWIIAVSVLIGRTMVPVQQIDKPDDRGMIWIWLLQVALFLLMLFLMHRPRSTDESATGQEGLGRALSRAGTDLVRAGSDLARGGSNGSLDSSLAVHGTDELLDLGAGPTSPPIPNRCLHEGVLDRWLADPQVPALWMEGEDKPRTAGALRAYASFCAARLLEGPVGRIVPVMAIMDDGVEFVAGIMGVMIAGAAFCPMDLTHPPDRVRYMLDSMEANVIVASRRAKDIVLEKFEWTGRLVDVDCSSKPKQTPYPTPPPKKGIDSPIYVIFTSGSTGKPKGTLLSHRALLSHIPYYTQRFELNSDPGLQNRILRTTAVTFDMCYSQILGALYSGATLIWPKKQLMKDPLEMRRVCETYGVSFLMMVPSALNLFLELSAFPSCVRHVGSGGEALHHEVARAFFADRYVDRSATATLHNRYGPTEAAINASLKVMQSPPSSRKSRTVPIGRPSAHRNMYICAPPDEENERTDNVLTLVEHGEQGEMYIGGQCLADGYLNNPEQTKKAFRTCSGFEDIEGRVVHDFDRDVRVYRTGDLMKWVGDELEFLGRVDSQVKLRGFRIELGEIEAQLRAVPGMQEAQVIVMNFAGDVQRIVAFVSPADMAEPPKLYTATSQLRKDLPEYMVPERFVGMGRDEWPRTTTGKIDRKELAKRNVPDTNIVGEPSVPAQGVTQGVDSLGFVRNMHRKERNIDIALDNLRAGIIILVVANHWTGVSWPNIQAWQAHVQRMVTANHTYALCLLSGIDDSRNINPFKFTAREPVFMLLYFIGLVNFVVTFPFWYFPVFVFVKVYTVAAHKLGVPSWAYCGFFTCAYMFIPTLGLQISTYGDREAAAAAGCFFLDTVFPWWQNAVTWLLGMYSYDQPYICFTVAPFYWAGLFGGPAVLEKTQAIVVRFKAMLPDVSSWNGFLSTQTVRFILLAIGIVAYNSCLLVLDTPMHACTQYRGQDQHYFQNTMWGIKKGLNYVIVSALSYIPLFIVILLLAWRSHWKTAGRCVVGAYFLHVFMPYLWWLKQPYSLNAFVNLWTLFQAYAPDDPFLRTCVALAQTLWVFVFPTIFLAVFGPFFMVGFVPCMRELSAAAADLSRAAISAGVAAFFAAHFVLSSYHPEIGFYNWLHDSLFGPMHALLAGTLLTLIVIILPVTAAALFATIVQVLPCGRRGWRRRHADDSSSSEEESTSESDPESRGGLLAAE